MCCCLECVKVNSDRSPTHTVKTSNNWTHPRRPPDRGRVLEHTDAIDTANHLEYSAADAGDVARLDAYTEPVAEAVARIIDANDDAHHRADAHVTGHGTPDRQANGTPVRYPTRNAQADAPADGHARPSEQARRARLTNG